MKNEEINNRQEMGRLRVLLLSPYDAMSHRYWRENLQLVLSDFSVEVVTLPPRYFSWRFRGNSLTLAHDPRLQQPFDLIIATSMTDLSALKGMLPSLSAAPSILYFHENQFAYPSQDPAAHQVERQITSLYAAIAADSLVFNSEFNRRSFFQGLQVLLKKLPDGIPKNLIPPLEQKSAVISVPVPARPLVNKPEGPRQIIWNHRWEYDKGIKSLLNLVDGLLERTTDFRFHLIGQSFRKQPQEIDEIIGLLDQADCLGHVGFVTDRAAYLDLLNQSHIVLSTAEHEFQGLAVLEALAAGCSPVVPDALAYQEFIPADHRYKSPQEALVLLEHQIKEATGVAPNLPAQVNPEAIALAWRKLVSQITS